MFAISKITVKGHTIVPMEVRKALQSNAGDLIAWEIEPNGHITIRRIQSHDVRYLQAVQATFCEWTTAEDEIAYRRL